MNPVVGLDVAKGESQVQAFLDKKKPYKPSFSSTKKIAAATPFLILASVSSITG